MKIVRYIGHGGSETWRCEKGTWRLGDAGPEGFVWLVTDLPEESFTETTTPRLFGKDLGALVNRQLAARFPETEYRTSFPAAAGTGLLEKLAPTRHILFGIDAGARLNAELDAHRVAAVCPMSMLLARLGQDRSLPTDLFVVLPGPDTLRIVFLRDRTPVLTRLTLTPSEPQAQLDEILRTVRHLENNQILPRGREHALMLLADSGAMAPLLHASRLRLVSLPKLEKRPPSDWRTPLFDLAIQSGAPQVAPMGRRVAYLSSRLAYWSRTLSVVIGLGGLLALGSNLGTILSLIGQDRAISNALQVANADVAAVDQEISRFGVTPELLREAIAISEREIDSVPALGNAFQLVANAIAVDPGLRVTDLQTRLILPSANTCSVDLTSEDGMKRPEATAPGVDKRRVEISFDLAIPGTYGPKDKAQTVRLVSQQLAEVPGISIWTDANKELSAGSLRGGTSVNAATRQGWCLTIPGVPSAATSETQDKAK